MEGVSLDVEEVSWRTDVVGKATNRSRVSSHVVLLPLSKEAHKEVTLELAVEHLGEEVEVGNEGSLENDGDVGGVEELDWEGLGEATDLSVLQSQFNTESLKYDTS